MNTEFFEIIANLKKIPRKGWQDKLGLSHPESVADHSYSVTAIAMTVSDILKLDTGKVVKMAILHDLAESITGDFTPGDITKKEKDKLENQTMNEIFQKIPKELSLSYRKLWEEFLENKSREANLVHEIDKLEMILQARIYQKQGHPKEKFESFIKTAKKEIKNPTLNEILAKLLQ